jgi:GYF domain 2
MKYFLWINGKQDGPYEPEQIREMLERGSIAAVTLGHPEDGTGEWSPIGSFPGVIEPPKPAAPAPLPPTVPAPKPAFSLPPVEGSGVARALIFFAALEFIGAGIGGLAVGNGHNENSGLVGFLIFACGILSGFILLGFAQVIEHTKESSQRLRRIEMLIQKAHDDKNSA